MFAVPAGFWLRCFWWHCHEGPLSRIGAWDGEWSNANWLVIDITGLDVRRLASPAGSHQPTQSLPILKIWPIKNGGGLHRFADIFWIYMDSLSSNCGKCTGKQIRCGFAFEKSNLMFPKSLLVRPGLATYVVTAFIVHNLRLGNAVIKYKIKRKT